MQNMFDFVIRKWNPQVLSNKKCKHFMLLLVYHVAKLFNLHLNWKLTNRIQCFRNNKCMSLYFKSESGAPKWKLTIE